MADVISADNLKRQPNGENKVVTDDVHYCFQTIPEDWPQPEVEKMVDGYSGFLFLDKEGMLLVAMHWEHRFNHMVKRYNDIYKEQIANIQQGYTNSSFLR